MKTNCPLCGSGRIKRRTWSDHGVTWIGEVCGNCGQELRFRAADSRMIGSQGQTNGRRRRGKAS